ncbi:universal stress protein [Maritimibacter sp. 55A14]|uniref:universal stress protein n=1 Tax=Maritimibacter sp. 55A14 TaxID=2174844 RepID=UPI000D6134DD|nr:universal stress protein [Maritimibacter sp. 55A14]PWE29302.1 universal stress protein [Maritimibacter sp. 55A14]
MYKHILVPIAGDHNPHTGEALEIARALRDKGGKITALTVLEAIPPYVAQHIPAGIDEKNREAALASLNAELGGVKDAKAEVVHGHSARTILEYAAEMDVDCIIIASHRPGMQDYFLGSTAAKVVRHAPCAVHVVR